MVDSWWSTIRTMVVYLLYGHWWSMAVYWQSIGLRLSVGGHRGRSSVPSWLRSRDFRSLSAPLLLLHPTCCRAVGLKRRAVASLEREQTVPAISTLSQLTRLVTTSSAAKQLCSQLVRAGPLCFVTLWPLFAPRESRESFPGLREEE